MTIHNNYSLKPHNTFGIDVQSKYFVKVNSVFELKQVLSNEIYKNVPKLILGGGSNILFTKNYEGLIIAINNKGIEVINEDEHYRYIKFAASEVWHNAVLFCVNNGFGGIENLSLIPGSCGAAPIQNIGAYGVEIKDVLTEVEVLSLNTMQIEILKNTDCKFGYRDSVFKNALKGKVVILSITLKLSKNHTPNVSYGTIEQELEKLKISTPNIKDVSNAVITIRESKLPNPKEIGNAGSFFKNPVITNQQYNLLKAKHSEIPGYSMGENTKVPAGWLIEQAGWKGKTFNNYGVHKKQALVLVNYGGAEGKAIYKLSNDIITDVNAKYGIKLNREVNCL